MHGIYGSWHEGFEGHSHKETDWAKRLDKPL